MKVIATLALAFLVIAGASCYVGWHALISGVDASAQTITTLTNISNDVLAPAHQ